MTDTFYGGKGTSPAPPSNGSSVKTKGLEVTEIVSWHKCRGSLFLRLIKTRITCKGSCWATDVGINIAEPFPAKLKSEELHERHAVSSLIWERSVPLSEDTAHAVRQVKMAGRRTSVYCLLTSSKIQIQAQVTLPLIVCSSEAYWQLLLQPGNFSSSGCQVPSPRIKWSLHEADHSLWHSGDRASWYILIIKPMRCTNFLNLLWNKTLHISDRFSFHHQESSIVHIAIGICHTSYADCWLATGLNQSNSLVEY